MQFRSTLVVEALEGQLPIAGMETLSWVGSVMSDLNLWRLAGRLTRVIAWCPAAALVIQFSGIPALGSSNHSRFPDPIERFISNYEIHRLDVQKILQQVKDRQEVSLSAGGHEFRLVLKLRDIRSPQYRAEAVTSSGKLGTVSSLPVQSYLGEVKGI